MEQYPDITNLALFLKVIEAGSFSKVCRQLSIPKASLSRRISQLEEFYGSQLLIRNTRHLQLTEVGREIHHRAHSILSLLDETQSKIIKAKARPSGLLRITAGVEYGLSVVSPIVDEFLKKYTDVNIELDLTGRRVDLIYEGFDLGVRIGPLDDSTMSMRKLGSFRYGIFAGQKFIDIHKTITIDKLAKIPTLAFTRINKQKTWTLVNQLEERTIEINPRLLSNNYWVLLNAAKSNNGVVFMPIFLAEKEVKRGGIQQILPSWCSEEISVHFIYPEQKYLTSKVRAFIDFATERMR